MVHKEKIMLSDNYEIKADISSAPMNKKHTIAYHPKGHQYKINDLASLLAVNGFKSIAEAKKNGWRFK